ncbi:peptidoglycan-binding protein [Nakamurella antarctica]|uniref:Peptidoglycan-binding protein n=1 Tax=Nakamurella antarctica TaxID=1902245 RepID=A0A3G8ZLH4_9ACTN|nr:peptidoglycan-binding domain-containing protein [Nakamurella antarctica]AZI58182.1 peptidoglycan-binding protein [Nakamurella antarctica]
MMYRALSMIGTSVLVIGLASCGSVSGSGQRASEPSVTNDSSTAKSRDLETVTSVVTTTKIITSSAVPTDSVSDAPVVTASSPPSTAPDSTAPPPHAAAEETAASAPTAGLRRVTLTCDGSWIIDLGNFEGPDSGIEAERRIAAQYPDAAIGVFAPDCPGPTAHAIIFEGPFEIYPDAYTYRRNALQTTGQVTSLVAGALQNPGELGICLLEPRPLPKLARDPSIGLGSGDEVFELTAWLLTKGYLDYSAATLDRPNFLTPEVEAGIITLQADLGVEADGIVGPVTWTAILGTACRAG